MWKSADIESKSLYGGCPCSNSITVQPKLLILVCLHLTLPDIWGRCRSCKLNDFRCHWKISLESPEVYSNMDFQQQSYRSVLRQQHQNPQVWLCRPSLSIYSLPWCLDVWLLAHAGRQDRAVLDQYIELPDVLESCRKSYRCSEVNRFHSIPARCRDYPSLYRSIDTWQCSDAVNQ